MKNLTQLLALVGCVLASPAIVLGQGMIGGQLRVAPMRVMAVEAIDEKDDEKGEGDKGGPECFRPLINVELSFVKRVCEPTEEQMTKIVAAAKEAHKAMASLVKPQNAVQAIRAQVMFMGPQGERMSINPYHRVREDMAKLLEPLVSPEQYAKYVEEARLRDEYERDAAVGIVLGMIDAKLALSADQRKAIYEKLMEEWKDIDLQWLQNYRNNPQYMPQMPDELISPVLTERQKELWIAATLQKVTMYANLGQGNPAGFTEEWLKK